MNARSRPSCKRSMSISNTTSCGRPFPDVSAYVQTQPAKERFTIPEAAVTEDQERPSVVVVEDVKTQKKGDEELQIGKVRKLFATLGVRDRERHVIELVSLEDAEKKAPV